MQKKKGPKLRFRPTFFFTPPLLCHKIDTPAENRYPTKLKGFSLCFGPSTKLKGFSLCFGLQKPFTKLKGLSLCLSKKWRRQKHKENPSSFVEDPKHEENPFGFVEGFCRPKHTENPFSFVEGPKHKANPFSFVEGFCRPKHKENPFSFVGYLFSAGVSILWHNTPLGYRRFWQEKKNAKKMAKFFG